MLSILDKHFEKKMNKKHQIKRQPYSEMTSFGYY